MALFAKKCTGCEFQFVTTSKPHKDAEAVCPQCGTKVGLGDAKALPEPAETAPKEATK
jgi:rRNA maturation endonuclease Nob1